MALPEIDPSRKITPRSRGELNHPGSCAVCGSGDPERTYVDFGIWFDYEGSVYICLEYCFKEAAVDVLGFFTNEQHTELLRLNNELIEVNEALRNELDNARPILMAVRGLNLDSVIGPDANGGVSDSVPDEVIKDGTDEQPEAPELPDGEGPTDTTGTEPSNGIRSTKPVIS